MSIDNQTAGSPVSVASGSGETKENTAGTGRFAIWAGTTQVDVDLPIDMPIGSMIFDLIQVLDKKLAEQGKDFSMFHANSTPGRWTLSEVGGPALNAEKTLSELGLDGDRLVLRRARSAEEYQPLIDDVTDAASMITDARFTAWSADMSRTVGAVIAVVGCVAVALLVGLYSVARRTQWLPPAIALVAAVVAVLGAWLAAERYRSPTLATALVIGAYPLAGVGGAAIVPGGWGSYNVALCAGTLIAVAVVSTVVLDRAITLAAAVLTVGTIVLIAALVRGFFSVSYVALGTGVALGAWIALWQGPKIALMAARIPMPPVPTLGMAFDEPDRSPRFIIDGAAGAQQYKAPGAEVFERRTAAAGEYLTGMVMGAALCAMGGTALAAEPGRHRYWLAFTFSLLLAAVVLRRARNGADGIQSAVLLGTGALIVAMTLVRLALADGRLWVVLAVVFGLSLASGVVLIAGVVLPQMRFNELQRRFGELVEVAMVALLPVLAFWIMDVYGALVGLRLR